MEKEKGRIYRIACDGSADYLSLSEAVRDAGKRPGERAIFLLAKGIYYERPVIELEDYLIQGAGREETVISGSAGARDPWVGEPKTGTFRSQTLFLSGGRAAIADISVENTAGDGADAGQAIALYADAGRVHAVNAAFTGNQDTLFTAPLPLREHEAGGFRGPREHAPRRPSRQYYHNCIISGNIDFIFGGADAVFDHCLIVPRAHRGCVSYISAASTPQGGRGYLFASCRVQGNAPPGSVFLGRPWRRFARVFWLDCELSEEIAEAGWDNWNNAQNESTVVFGESGSKGKGSTQTGRRAFGLTDDPEYTELMRSMLSEFRSEFGSHPA